MTLQNIQNNISLKTFKIMVKFQSLNYKYRLKNAQHFAFIQAFITALTAAGFTAAKIVAKLAELVTAFGVEDRYSLPRTTWVMPIRWSSTTLAKLYVGSPSDLSST